MNKTTHILAILLTLIATVLWSIGSWWYYSCRIKNTCNTPLVKTVDQTDQNNNKQTAAITPLKIPATDTDTDKDGDGLSDKIEQRLKTDIDNQDTDHDGISDKQEIGKNTDQPLDTDGDGIIDALDEDDDNDGLTTQVEVKVGTSPLLADTDNDGINDLKELGGNLLKPLDTDSDGIIDALDTDDDDDGIKTEAELLLGINPLLADTDSDGISDLDEVGKLLGSPIDSDKDGIIDALDTEENLDQDGDGLSDVLEKKLHSDPKNVDSDDDGINDNIELGDNSNKPLDTDNDGIINILDPDDDNDNLDTRFESEIGTNPLSADTDGDSLNDATEVAGGSVGNLRDTDKDGKIDPVDSDDDNDGIATLTEIKNGTNPFVDEKAIVNNNTNKKPARTAGQLGFELTNANSTKQFKDAQIDVPDNIQTISSSLIKQDINDYLKLIVKWLKKDQKNTISLIAYSNLASSEKENLANGIKLLMSLRKILIQQGAPYQQIDVISRGSAIANKTDAKKTPIHRIEITPLNY